MTEIKDATIIVKWSGKEYPITDLTDQDTVAVLKHEIFKKTQVRPERQKLLNLKYKGTPFRYLRTTNGPPYVSIVFRRKTRNR